MNQKQFLKLFFLVLATAWVLAACSTATPAATQQPIVVTDGLGRTVTLPAPAQRVVSLAPSNTEILYAIGAGSQVVGRDDFSDYPSEAGQLPSIGGSMGDYNTEAIVGLKPDLVLAAEINTTDLVKTLEDLGLTVYLLSNPQDLPGMYANLETLAQLTGHQDETAKLVESLKTRVAAVEDRVKNASGRPVVFYELDATDTNSPYTSGPGTFIDRLITMSGGTNLGADLEGQYAPISLEELVVRDPEIILLGDAVWGGVTPEIVAQRAGWENLSAVKNGKVFPFDDNLVSRPGPRLVDGLEAMAKLLHPELFQ